MILYIKYKVKRFPNNFLYGFYSTHEKVVIIDEEIAYVGGIDLFWGRYDTEEYSIKEESNTSDLYYWPGVEYSNDRITDRLNSEKYLEEYIDRDKMPRMPWHDLTVRLQGPIVIDVYRHFLQRWNYASELKYNYPISYGNTFYNIFFITFLDNYLDSIDKSCSEELFKINKNSSLNNNLLCQAIRSASAWSTGNPVTEHSIFNAYLDLIDNSKHYIFIVNQFFISSTCLNEIHESKIKNE